MTRLINALQSKDSRTANGAVTHSTSGSYLLDLFYHIGSSTNFVVEDLVALFLLARGEDVNKAYRILFWSRDPRGGAGLRLPFQVLMKEINKRSAFEYEQASIFIDEFGYFKDYFVIEEPNPNNINYLSIQLDENKNAPLLAKWWPRKGKWFYALMKERKLSPKETRKLLVEKSNTVEQLISAGKFDAIEYGKIPSKAMMRHNKSFLNNDKERYEKYLESVAKGEEKINAGTLYPHEVLMRRTEANSQALWEAMPNFLEGNKENILVMCDVSGSMGVQVLPNVSAMLVAISLTIYIAERMEGGFKDSFLTFSATPELVTITDGKLATKYDQIKKSSWGYNTNLSAAFERVLRVAIDHEIPEEDMPTKILILSDMEFDMAVKDKTNYTAIRLMYKNAGYKMPSIVFWNLNAKSKNVPIKQHNKDVALVSGFSPSILTSVLGDISPIEVMERAIKPYEKVRIDEPDL